MHLLTLFIHLILVCANTETALIKIDSEWPVQNKTCTNCITPDKPFQLSLNLVSTRSQELWIEFAQFNPGKRYHFKTCWPATYPLKVDLRSKVLPPEVAVPKDILLLDKDETRKPRFFLVLSIDTDYYLVDTSRNAPLEEVPIEIQVNENKIFGLISTELIILAGKGLFTLCVGIVFRNLVWSVLK